MSYEHDGPTWEFAPGAVTVTRHWDLATESWRTGRMLALAASRHYYFGGGRDDREKWQQATVDLVNEINAVPVGTLVSPIQNNHVWVPGENVAKCPGHWRVVFKRRPADRQTHDTYVVRTEGPPLIPTAVPFLENANLGHWGEGCSHGFYAYYNPKDSENNYGRLHAIFGVIEAYGHVVMGTKGVRAEKAKIVAVAAPKDQRSLIRGRYPDVEVFKDDRRGVRRMLRAHRPSGKPVLPS